MQTTLGRDQQKGEGTQEAQEAQEKQTFSCATGKLQAALLDHFALLQAPYESITLTPQNSNQHSSFIRTTRWTARNDQVIACAECISLYTLLAQLLCGVPFQDPLAPIGCLYLNEGMRITKEELQHLAFNGGRLFDFICCADNVVTIRCDAYRQDQQWREPERFVHMSLHVKPDISRNHGPI
jgi:hypothetical protein